jgi:hypothetical protein
MGDKIIVRRTVIVSPDVPKEGRPRLWAFGYRDYARLFGCTEEAVRDMAKRGLDLGDLDQVCAEWLRRRSARLVRDGNW